MHPLALFLTNIPICSATSDHPLLHDNGPDGLTQSHQTTNLPVSTDPPPNIHHLPLCHGIPVAHLHYILMPTDALAHTVPSTHLSTHMKCQHGNPCLHPVFFHHIPQMIPVYSPIPTSETCRVHLSTPIPAYLPPHSHDFSHNYTQSALSPTD